MSDHPVPTLVYTDEGELPFQEYFVHRQCRPKVSGFQFQNAAQALPAPGILEAVSTAELVIICPSNPWVSVDPILVIPGMKAELMSSEITQREPGLLHRVSAERRPIIAVSPIIGGEAVKGPAAKMYRELGVEPSALAVARHYGAAAEGGLLAGFVMDELDSDLEPEVQALGMETLVTHTLMGTAGERLRLAKEVLEFAKYLLN